MQTILVHTALKQEAKPIIEYFKLRCVQTKPYKIYCNDILILIIAGMGAQNTHKITDIFERYTITKAISIGIAGCKDNSVKIGSLFCTTHHFANIAFADITLVDVPLDNPQNLDTMLVDMEAQTFLQDSCEFLNPQNIYIFKIISDHLDTTIPKKEFVWKIIKQNLKSISQALDLLN